MTDFTLLFSSMFKKEILDRWSKAIGFIQRKRILSAFEFLVLMTIGQLGMTHPSLSGMVDAIKVQMSRESLHYRFNSKAVAFLKFCLDFAIEQKVIRTVPIKVEIMEHFNRVLLIDSSSWDVDQKLKNVLPGSGGDASSANCKLQTCYDYKKGELVFFDITPGNKPDNSFTAQLPDLTQNKDLIIFDLGYFKLETFKRIVQKGAFFLSRFLTNTNLKDSETGAPIELDDLLKSLKGNAYQMQVLMGSQIKVPCRLICLRVSQQVSNQRRRRLIKEAQKKGRTPNQKNLRLCDWTLMVTSIPEEWLAPEMVRPLYTLRWQIELLFKQFKSVLRIHCSDTCNEYRLLCEVYGKLIMAVLIHCLHADINIKLWNTTRRELSMDKLHKRIQERAFLLMRVLLSSIKEASLFFKGEIECLIKNCMKNRQRSRMTTIEMLEKGFSEEVINISLPLDRH